MSSKGRKIPGAPFERAPADRWSIAANVIAGFAVLMMVRSAAGSMDDQGVSTAVARARSCVLKVECLEDNGAHAQAVLSAVVLDNEGYLATIGLRSVGDRVICVRDCDGKKYEARWIATDDHTGVSLLKIEPGVVRAPAMRDDLPSVGATVIVVGNPFGLSHSVSRGIVSGLDRSVSLPGGVGRGMIQFTGQVFPGDGGGLIADRDGQMLGIISTALRDPTAEDVTARSISGIGFALPALELRRITQRLRDGRPVERGYLGLTAEDSEPAGVRVLSVLPESAAEQADIRPGDVIEALDDQEVESFDDLAARIERLPPGRKIVLQIKRDGEEMRMQAILGERPERTAARRSVVPPWIVPFDLRSRHGNWGPDPLRRFGAAFSEMDRSLLGVQTQPVSDSLAKRLGLANTDGALVSSVISGSAADRAGVRTSDVLVRWNDEPIRSPADLQERIRQAGTGATVRVGIVRDGKAETLEVTLAHFAIAPGAGDFEGGYWLPEPFRLRLESLEKRVKTLESKLEELQKQVEGKRPETDSSQK